MDGRAANHRATDDRAPDDRAPAPAPAGPAGEPASLVALHSPPGVALVAATVLASMVASLDAAVVAVDVCAVPDRGRPLAPSGRR